MMMLVISCSSCDRAAIDGLHPYTPIAHRETMFRVPVLRTAPNANPQYRLRGADEIVLTPPSWPLAFPGGDDPCVQGGTLPPGTPSSADLESRLVVKATLKNVAGDVVLFDHVESARLSVHLLERIGCLRLYMGGTGVGAASTLDKLKPGMTLRDAQVVLAPLLRVGFSLRIVPSTTNWAKPGDRISVTRMSRNADEVPFVERFDVLVDSDGSVVFPAIKPILSAGAASFDKNPVVRFSESLAEQAYLRVQLWRRGVAYGEIPNLAFASACISAAGRVATTTPKWEPLALPGCAALDVDSPVALDGQRFDVRYRLERMQAATWTLVHEGRTTLPFVEGETIREGVIRAARSVRGRDIIGTVSPPRSVYVTVVPDPAFGTTEERTPFWAQMEAETGSVLDHVLLLPGDTVFVGTTEPKEMKLRDVPGVEP